MAHYFRYQKKWENTMFVFAGLYLLVLDVPINSGCDKGQRRMTSVLIKIIKLFLKKMESTAEYFQDAGWNGAILITAGGQGWYKKEADIQSSMWSLSVS